MWLLTNLLLNLDCALVAAAQRAMRQEEERARLFVHIFISFISQVIIKTRPDDVRAKNVDGSCTDDQRYSTYYPQGDIRNGDTLPEIRWKRFCLSGRKFDRPSAKYRDRTCRHH